MQKVKVGKKFLSFTYDFMDDYKQTPLHYACQLNKLECAKILLFHAGCNINICGKSGFRPRDLI